MEVRWSLSCIAVLMVVPLAGCMGGGDEANLEGADQPQHASSLHPELPDEPLASQLSPGITRALVNDDADTTRLYGFDLVTFGADWAYSSDGAWRTSDLHLAPFGELEGYVALLFQADRLVAEVYGMPHERDWAGPVDDLLWPTPGVEATHIWMTDFTGEPYRMVVALVGAGGLAMGMHNEPSFNPMSWSFDRLARESIIVQPTTGTGTGMTFDAYLENDMFAWNERLRYGEMEVEDRIPVDLDPNDVAWDITTRAPEGFGGWALYRSSISVLDGSGLFDARAEHDTVDQFDGPFHYGLYTTIAWAVLVGMPQFEGIGDLAAPLSSRFEVQAVGSGVGGYIDHMQLTLGVPLGALIGLHQEFEVTKPEGAVAPGADTWHLHGSSIVIENGQTQRVLVGAAR